MATLYIHMAGSLCVRHGVPYIYSAVVHFYSVILCKEINGVWTPTVIYTNMKLYTIADAIKSMKRYSFHSPGLLLLTTLQRLLSPSS